jgi:hypothetical protein
MLVVFEDKMRGSINHETPPPQNALRNGASASLLLHVGKRSSFLNFLTNAQPHNLDNNVNVATTEATIITALPWTKAKEQLSRSMLSLVHTSPRQRAVNEQTIVGQLAIYYSHIRHNKDS